MVSPFAFRISVVAWATRGYLARPPKWPSSNDVATLNVDQPMVTHKDNEAGLRAEGSSEKNYE